MGQEQTEMIKGMKGNILSLISHEMRSPLNAVNGYLDLLLAGVGGDLNGQQREFVRRARAGSEHLYALLEDFFLIARADMGSLRLNREIMVLAEVVEDAVEELEVMAADHDIEVKVEIGRNVPRLYADVVRIRQVVRNLLSNALCWTREGGQVRIAVEAELEDEGGREEGVQIVKLRVSDDGVGIASEYQERIFERFFRVPDVEGGHGSGQGLGLSVVKMIVELHGGQVEVESVVGRGSTFTCILPCVLG